MWKDEVMAVYSVETKCYYDFILGVLEKRNGEEEKQEENEKGEEGNRV